MLNLATLDQLRISMFDPKFLNAAADSSHFKSDDLKLYISTSFEEARLTLSLLKNIDLEGKQVLEFGSGLGLASIVLHLNGIKITSFEPGGLGFEKNLLLSQFIKKYFKYDFTLKSEIPSLERNSYDYIFSNNVLEHIENLDETLSILNSTLKKGGKMIHNIPNYIFPFEPHFGILFFPIYPKKMSFLLPNRITKTSLYQSINFVNFFDIKKYGKKNNALVTFKKGLLYSALKRLNEDAEYGNRHSSIKSLITILQTTKLLSIFKFVPNFLSTPMIFEWEK